MNTPIRFWGLLRELNELTTILAINNPEYRDRVNELKSELTTMINKQLEEEEKQKKQIIDNWYVRNN